MIQQMMRRVVDQKKDFIHETHELAGKNWTITRAIRCSNLNYLKQANRTLYFLVFDTQIKPRHKILQISFE